jgi:hypothetical protein
LVAGPLLSYSGACGFATSGLDAGSVSEPRLVQVSTWPDGTGQAAAQAYMAYIRKGHAN